VLWWGTKAAEGGPSHANKAQVILSGKGIIKVACGATTSYAMSKGGRVWRWSNDEPSSVKEISVPGGLLVSPPVVDIAACATGHHFVCVTADGRALAMGAGDRGQLGCGDCETKPVLTPVKLPKGAAAARYGATRWQSCI